MKHLLAKLTPITGRAIRTLDLAKRLQAIQDCILALAEGQNITTTGGLKRGYGMGALRLDAGKRGKEFGGGGKVECPFGEIIPIEDETAYTRGIRGGVVYAGDKNLDVPYQGLNLVEDGVWLVQLKIPVEANRDDDGEILLPGIKTSSATDPSTFWDNKVWTTGTSYDDNTQPEVADGLGEIVIPLGKLTIEDGAAKFEKVACGNVNIGQCAGVLSHTRE